MSKKRKQKSSRPPQSNLPLHRHTLTPKQLEKIKSLALAAGVEFSYLESSGLNQGNFDMRCRDLKWKANQRHRQTAPKQPQSKPAKKRHVSPAKPAAKPVEHIPAFGYLDVEYRKLVKSF